MWSLQVLTKQQNALLRTELFGASGIEELIALFVLCILLKQSFAFFPPFWGGVYIHMENKCGQIQDSLDCPPDFILCLCISFVFLFSLPCISNPNTPTLKV